MLLPDASPAFRLDRTMLLRWARTCAVIFLPVCVAALSRLQSGEVPDADLLAAAFASALIDLLRRYATDYSSSAR